MPVNSPQLFWRHRAERAYPTRFRKRILVLAFPCTLELELSILICLKGLIPVSGRKYFGKSGLIIPSSLGIDNIDGIVILYNQHVYQSHVQEIIRHNLFLPVLVIRVWGHIDHRDVDAVIIEYKNREAWIKQFDQFKLGRL